MKDYNREALTEYLDSQRQLKSAWDSFHRRALRQTFIHCRLAIHHLLSAFILLEREEPGEEPMGKFFRVAGDRIPLEKAESFHLIFQPPELKPLGKVNRKNLSESVNDWLITRKISRTRAFEHLSLTQDMVNLTINLMESKHPAFFRQINR